MRRLIGDLFATAFDGLGLQADLDAALLDVDARRLAFTTDSFVVKPLVFPGGDIGKLAVYGTVNDLATSGATPRWISISFILEEGFPIETLWELALSVREAAVECGVSVVTGDTKVVDRGNGDGVFITTSGVGLVRHNLILGPSSIRPRDVLLVSGDLARHGMAIMATREGLGFQSSIISDCAPLHRAVGALIDAGLGVRCVRDLTRGGLTAATNELAESSGLSFLLREDSIPVREDVRAACEILGLDPLYVANEGTMLIVLAADDAEAASETLANAAGFESAAVIGEVRKEGVAPVTLMSTIGVERILDLPVGEQLPRIC